MIFNISKSVRVFKKTLLTGSTTLTFSGVKDDDLVEVFTDTYGVNPSSQTYSASTGLTLTFPAQTSDVIVKVRCS